MSDWISVKDQRPRKKGFYLVVYSDHRPVEMDEWGIWHFDNGRHWGFYADADAFGRVTHWMPLPDPPEAQAAPPETKSL